MFDVSRQVQVLDIEKGQVVGRHEALLPGTDPQTQASVLMMLGPQVLICGAISLAMADRLATTNIQVLPFTAGNVEEVLAAWLTGNLPSQALSMPGCCGQRRRCHGGKSGGRGGQGSDLPNGHKQQQV